MSASVAKNRATVTLPSDTTIRIERRFDVPKHLVFKAWTTPELVARWWPGNRGVAVSTEIDLRVGGKWRWVMHVTDRGFDIAFNGEYREIVPSERLVYTESFEGYPGEPAVNTIVFADTTGGTLVTLLVEHANKHDRDMHVNSGMEGGMQEALQLLEEIAGELNE